MGLDNQILLSKYIHDDRSILAFIPDFFSFKEFNGKYQSQIHNKSLDNFHQNVFV